MKYLLLFLFLITFLNTSYAFGKQQKDSVLLRKERFIPLVTGAGLTYSSSIVLLSSAWYNNQSTFHFYNDNHHWLQMDKAGHAFSAFQISQFAIKSLGWSGVERKRAVWYGGLAGFILLTPIEIFDGFSPDYGASYGDLLANATGSALLLTQYLLWDEPRVQLKFSFLPTPYASNRPQTLGRTIPEQALKDYNGQTYWLSWNIHSFLPEGNKFPAWLNLSLGYSGSDMQYGTVNQNRIEGFNPYRQYFISFDFDFEHVKTQKKWLKALTYPLKIVRIPFPVLEFNRYGVGFHPVYF